MELTKRQALFLIVICLMANKVQRLPSLISSSVGRHGWLVFLLMGIVDVIFLLLVLLFNKKTGSDTTYQTCQRTGGKWFAKVIYVLLGVYFLAKALLPYEAVHDIFANILFDYLSWESYSLVLALTIFFIANRRLRNIGRLGEIFFYIIAISFIVLLVLGAATTNYHRILPVKDINVPEFIDTCLEYSLWFGDFLIIYAFVGRIKQDDGYLGWPLILVYGICVLVLSFTYIVFYGLYEHLSPNQNSLISAISQFSLLNLEIGRIDWFFVLFFQIATVVSCGVYLHLASDSFRQVFGLKEKKYVALVLTILIYLADIFVFKSIQAGASAIASVSKYFTAFMSIILPIILLIAACVANKKKKRKIDKVGENLKPYCFLSRMENVESKMKRLKKPKLLTKQKESGQ